MAKRTKKEQSTEIKDKDIIARQRVEQLLADVDIISKAESTTTDKEEEDDGIITNEAKRSKNWLEEQIHKLSERNEQLEKELQDAKDSFKKLSADFMEYKRKVSVSPSDSELKQKIIELFTKFENAYLGKNPTGERYTHVKLVNPPYNTGVLDEFIKAFGDILKNKK